MTLLMHSTPLSDEEMWAEFERAAGREKRHQAGHHDQKTHGRRLTVAGGYGPDGMMGSALTEKQKAKYDAMFEQAGKSRAQMAAELREGYINPNLAAGKAWYNDAHEVALGVSGGDVTKGAAVLAACSPRCGWKQNKTMAQRTFDRHGDYPDLEGKALGAAIGGGLTGNLGKAGAIARGQDPDTALSGLKVRSFNNNIAFPNEGRDVTVDAWASRTVERIAGPSLFPQPKTLETKMSDPVHYAFASDIFREAADGMGLVPLQAQAAAWVTERGRAD